MQHGANFSIVCTMHDWFKQQKLSKLCKAACTLLLSFLNTPLQTKSQLRLKSTKSCVRKTRNKRKNKEKPVQNGIEKHFILKLPFCRFLHSLFKNIHTLGIRICPLNKLKLLSTLLGSLLKGSTSLILDIIVMGPV